MKKYIFCVIDDDFIYQFTIKKILSNLSLPIDIIIFQNGQLALDFLTENVENESVLPDLIFLDINMPVKNGWQFLEDYESLHTKLKKQNQIYLVSSSIDSQDTEKAAKNKLLSGYIYKPVTKEKILKATNLIES
jgi:two-component SAPR family response regulator